MRGVLPLAVCFLLFTVSASPAESPKKTRGEVVKKEKQLESLKREIVEKKKSLAYNVNKENAILGELERLDKAISKAENESRDIGKRLFKLKQNKSDVDARVRRLLKEKERLAGLLDQRLSVMYKMRKDNTAIKTLFSADSANDLSRRYSYISSIVEYDALLLKDYGDNQLLLEQEQERLKELQGEMISLKYEVEKKRNDILDEERRKKAFLNDIRKKKDMQLAAIREVEDASKELQLFLDRLKIERDSNPFDETDGFASMRGNLPMPVEGKIISMYGKSEHPKFHTVTFNNGIEIEAGLGAAVKSVYRGRVAYSGWFRGYGKVIIIDHANGYYTLFARLSEIMKEVDSFVEKGDIIALVGDTGSVKGPHLYFEIRKKGVPLDPLNWLAYR